MHKKILVLLTGVIALSISAVPVLASDPPTDDGQYIWQDENGDTGTAMVPRMNISGKVIMPLTRIPVN